MGLVRPRDRTCSVALPACIANGCRVGKSHETGSSPPRPGKIPCMGTVELTAASHPLAGPWGCTEIFLVSSGGEIALSPALCAGVAASAASAQRGLAFFPLPMLAGASLGVMGVLRAEKMKGGCWIWSCSSLQCSPSPSLGPGEERCGDEDGRGEEGGWREAGSCQERVGAARG